MTNLINTTLGLIEESQLIRVDGSFENEIEKTTWVEYRLKDALADSDPIHRSVHVTLKDPTISNTSLGE